MSRKSIAPSSYGIQYGGSMQKAEAWEDEDSPEAKLREAVFRPFANLNRGLNDVANLAAFAREHIEDKEFTTIIFKKLVRDLRAAADRFESETKE